VLVEPARRLREGRHGRHLGGRVRRREVAQHAGFLELRLAALGYLHGEQPLVNDLAESIHDTRPVEVDTRGMVVLERIEGRTLAEDVKRPRVGVPPDRLEQRMTRRDPLQLLGFGRLTVRRAARVAVCESRELPIRLLFVAAENRRRARRLERVRQARNGLESKGHELGRLAEKARDGLGHDAPLLCTGTPLDQHREVQLLAGQPLQRVLTNRTKLALVHVAQQALLEVAVPQAPGIVVA
jgi:hypothetical protein